MYWFECKVGISIIIFNTEVKSTFYEFYIIGLKITILG